MGKSQQRGQQSKKAQGEGPAGEPGNRTGDSSGQLDQELRQLNKLRKTVRRNVIDALSNAAKVEVVGVRTAGETGLTLHLEVDGSPIKIEVSGMEVVEGDLDTAMREVKGRRARLNRVKRPEELSVQELKERNLPLYWNEEWLRAELDRLGSYAEIARVHGFPSSVTIASYAKRKFGIDVQAEYAKKRQAVYDDFDSGDYTQLDLANKHGVAVATVYRWLKERSEGKDQPARRGQRTAGRAGTVGQAV